MRRKAATVNEVKEEEITFEDLKKEVALLKAQLRCYKCDQMGHIQRECPMRGRGRGERHGGRGRRGNRGRGRSKNNYVPASNFGQPNRNQDYNRKTKAGGQPVYTVSQDFEAEEDQQQGNE